MIIVQLDKLGYFTGSYAKIGSIPNGVKVDSLPTDLSNYKTTCWKYGEYEVEVEVEVPVQGEPIQVPVIDEETGEQVVDENGELVFETQDGEITMETEIVKETRIGWIFDEVKHKALLKEIEDVEPVKTQEEINAELMAKNEELEATLDMVLTEIIPSIAGMLA